MMRALQRSIRRFFRREDGSFVVESVLVLPLLFWAHLGLFAYWNVYAATNTVQKATYTISDLITRQQASVNDAYLTGLRDVMNYLVDSPSSTKLRVTSFRYSEANKRYEVIWSRSPNSALSVLNNASLVGLKDRLPLMSDGDSAVLVETEVRYEPTLAYGITTNAITQFVVTRPRFLAKICHVNFTC
jgi:hypothetical protein